MNTNTASPNATCAPAYTGAATPGDSCWPLTRVPLREFSSTSMYEERP